MHAQFHHVSLLASWSRKPIILYKIVRLTLCQNTVNQDNNRMPHYFYGDYQGTPGSLVTFLSCPY